MRAQELGLSEGDETTEGQAVFSGPGTMEEMQLLEMLEKVERVEKVERAEKWPGFSLPSALQSLCAMIWGENQRWGLLLKLAGHKASLHRVCPSTYCPARYFLKK